MKKSFPVNINGRIYNIDEDAYALLNNYIDQLKSTFPGEEGAEIVNDLEGRMSELLSEWLCDGRQVVTIDDVNRIISTMGRPEDLGDSATDSATTAGQPSDPMYYGNEPQTDSDPAAATPPPFSKHERPVHKLYRNIDNKVFGGVLSGIATYLGTDTNLIRVLMILLTIFTAFWPCFVCYLIAWAVIPPADTPRRRLELRGEAVSVEAVGRGVLDNDRRSESSSNLTVFLTALAKCSLGFVGLMAGFIGLAMSAAIIALLVAMIAMPFNANISAQLTQVMPVANVVLALVFGILVCTLILLPCIALVWLTLNVIFGVKSCGKGLIIGAGIAEILIFIAVMVISLILGTTPLGWWWWADAI